MEDIIIKTILLMKELKFTPLVLIGLLITSLSLILNLKDTNKYIKKFKEHKNIEIFINKIYKLATILIVMFIISIASNYVTITLPLVLLETIIYGTVSLFYLICMIYISYTLFAIVFMLKEIVKTSLKNEN